MSAHKPASEGVIEIAPLAEDLPPETSEKPMIPHFQRLPAPQF
jgi:hypothetical protein